VQRNQKQRSLRNFLTSAAIKGRGSRVVIGRNIGVIAVHAPASLAQSDSDDVPSASPILAREAGSKFCDRASDKLKGLPGRWSFFASKYVCREHFSKASHCHF